MQLPTPDLYPHPRTDGDVVPIVRGASGLTGRPEVVREYEVEPTEPDAEGTSLPTHCLRRLSVPEAILLRSGELCSHECDGRQEDGGCLVEKIRALPDGAAWHCEVRAVDEWGNVAWALIED